jgi:hypothetical protein
MITVRKTLLVGTPAEISQKADELGRTLAMGRADDDAAREIAGQLEGEHPWWIVVFGTYTKEFVCFPRFRAPRGFRIVAMYPKAAAERMSEVERLYKNPGGSIQMVSMRKALWARLALR